ncbi:MAG TPA: RNA 3'-terminal phosphate cyclase [Actinomycetes bacterium]|jgi:RNA 3'-terminal phosphate cyclase (ATP)|nr:RNA 3'-terminal phosphate cyclase [Actinomycetes bacterium]
MIEIDGASHSGSGSVVRQAVAYAAVTGQPVRVVNVRARRPRPGLRHQHLRAIQAICQLVGGTLQGAAPGARAFTFQPGRTAPSGRHTWDIGSAGSTTMLALALLPLLAVGAQPVAVELRGGLFQDFAPSLFHLRHALLPLLARMGATVRAELVRPGYVPRGGGILRLAVIPARGPLRPLLAAQPGSLQRLWGIALASHLAQRRVSARMADAARKTLAAAGQRVTIQEVEDTSALQPGAALALFADLQGGTRLGADRAGAPHRAAEAIGTRVARQLQDELASGACVDRFVADQLLPFCALAAGDSRVRIPQQTEHVRTGMWLARVFVGVQARLEGQLLVVPGCGHA